ncbi:GTPase [Aureococcus anophagefferens]|nr:GTPase [Aureococcus anophagefferens]
MGRRGKRPTTPPAVPGGPRVASPTDAQVPRSYGREEEEGATEYKLSLCSAGSNRVKKLVTQCLYRLTEGHGRAVYRVGVEDDGTPKGLDRAELGASLRTLRCIARQNGAALNPCAVFEVSPGHFVAEVVVDVGCDADDAAVKFAAKREKWRTAATAEAEDDETEEDDDDDGSARRVAVIGSQGSGKSTLVGVLKSGMLDDGRGLARQLVLRHGHEVRDGGRTSALNEVRCGGLRLVDGPGSEKYLKTTIFGLTALRPRAALLAVDARRAAKLGRMTLEHLGVAIALRIPVVVALTHADLAADVEADGGVRCGARGRARRARRRRVVRDGRGLRRARGRGGRRVRRRLGDGGVERRRGRRAAAVVDAAFRDVPGAGTVLGGTVVGGDVRVGARLALGPVDLSGAFVDVEVARSASRATAATPQRRSSATFAIGHGAEFRVASLQGKAVVEFTAPDASSAAGVATPKPRTKRAGATVFAADVLVLAAPDGGLAAGFEAVVHADAVRQAARLLFADGAGGVAAGSTRKCTFELLYHPEYLVPGTRLILRDGRTRAVGTVVSVDVQGSL